MKQPSITTTLLAFLAHSAIAERGAVNISPWHPRLYGVSFATRWDATLAISPRKHPPSHEITGIFPSTIILFPTTSPKGHTAALSSISMDNFCFDSFISLTSFLLGCYFLGSQSNFFVSFDLEF